MTKQIQSIRGMNDILPTDINHWHEIERYIRQVTNSYGYQEIRTPIVESTSLFQRSIGEVTDIVEKEMYTFDDRNGDSLSLRPEGTASVVRSGNQHSLLYNQEQRFWYMGPMFRHERPQKGRSRQFTQFGVEVFGIADVEMEAELILMSARLWECMGIKEHVYLEINNIGSQQERSAFKKTLIAYLEPLKNELDADSQRRLYTNPLRILDSKIPETQTRLQGAPKLIDFLQPDSIQSFEKLCALLHSANIEYTVNPNLVRGIDYYNHTVFEWKTDALGAQGTILGGGRYDTLVETMGGRATPAIGFAAGLERLVLLQQTLKSIPESTLDLFVISLGEPAQAATLPLVESIRTALPHLSVIRHAGGGALKKQMKRADKSHAPIALIVGEQEINEQTVIIKNLRTTGEQETIAQADLIDFLRQNQLLTQQNMRS